MRDGGWRQRTLLPGIRYLSGSGASSRYLSNYWILVHLWQALEIRILSTKQGLNQGQGLARCGQLQGPNTKVAVQSNK